MGKHSSSSPSRTPAEAEAYQAAQPYLNEYNSGKLNAADQATANLADTNQTAGILQSFASSGMSGSSALASLVGNVTKGNASEGMQAGAGSTVDLNKLTLTQQILQSDLNTGMAYMQISAGQAADLAGAQQEQSQMLADAFGKAAGGFASIMGSGGAGEGAAGGATAGLAGIDDSLDPNTPYYGPGSMNGFTINAD